MELKTFFAQDTSGNILPGATVTVYQADTLTLVTGLQDEDGAALSNPFTATSGGKVAFYAPDGLYDILVVSGGSSVTIRSQFADVSNAATLGANTFTGAQTLPGNASAALHAVPKQQLDAGLSASAPPGAVMAFAQNVAPTGWLKANGQTVSRTTYAALFAAIGTTYGAGNGSTTFALPDLRGEFVRGWDDGRGVDASRAIGSAQAGQMPSHTHTQRIDNGISGGALNFARFNATGNISSSVNTDAQGGTENGSENRPRNIALLYCIKF